LETDVRTAVRLLRGHFAVEENKPYSTEYSRQS
jgi:hypothetical protein